MHGSNQARTERLAIFQAVFIWVLLTMTWLENLIPYFISGVRYLLLLSQDCISCSQSLIGARFGARGLQPPESDSSVPWCAGSSPWQHLCLICHRRKCFQTCPRRNSGSNGKVPAVSALWHQSRSGSEGGKALCHLLPDSSL